ncbi:MAG TPA: hypothetical protein VEU30_11170 [Thermoanaerobaculia bacterium]|nr:hypothetical protein [Thermoanaerobaculia bacterium]
MNKQTERPADQYPEPPTADEMLAYSRGQLSPEAAAEVWERLQQHPDLAAIYTAPFPEDGGDYVTPEQLDARWTEVRSQLGITPRNVLWFPRILSAVAAVLILALSGLLWQSQRRVRELEIERTTPRVMAKHELPPDAHFRGSPQAVAAIRADADAQLLIPTTGDFGDYEVEIRTVGKEARTVWRQGELIQSTEGELVVTVLRDTLQPGDHQLVLYGNGGKQLDTFTFTVER